MSARFVVYSDGSSISNPGGPGGTGYVVLDRQTAAVRFGSKRYVDDGDFAVTNNRMELRAVLEALEGLPEGETVEVTSDSIYAIKALSVWLQGWRKKGWKNAEGKPVMNRDLIERIDEKARALKVRYAWVRGHNGHAVNEVVDALANSAARGIGGPSADDVTEALRRAGLVPAQ
jgi:ribonuclease HI